MTTLFVGLKLTNHIDWSWWYVLSPMIGSFLLLQLIRLLVSLLSDKMVDDIMDRREGK